jgi:hypothetical protein
LITRLLSVPMWTAVAVLCALAFARALLPAPALYLFPLTEDGYYSLSVARNLGTGHGLTIDGTHLTNGIQPLWVFVTAPLFSIAGGDRDLGLRLVLLLHWLIYVATIAAVCAIARRVAGLLVTPGRGAQLAVPLAALIYASNITLFELHFNGLETGLVLLLHGLVVLRLARIDWRRARDVWSVGALAALLCLTRLDAAFLVALLPFCAAWQPGLTTRQRLRAAVIVWGCAAVVLVPWLIFGLVGFGHLMPTSGLAQTAWRFSPGRLLVAFMYLLGNAFGSGASFYWPGRYQQVCLGLLLAGAAWAIVAARRTGSIEVRRAVSTAFRAQPASVVLLMIACGIALAAWYALSSGAWWMYQRYTAPIVVLTLPAIAAVIAGARRGPAIAALLACASLAVTWLSFAGPGAAMLRLRVHYDMVRMAGAYVPAGDRLAAVQSGTLGFFRDGVTNLDGKVNGDALSARGSLEAYCHSVGVRWLLDWPASLRALFPGGLSAGWRLVTEQHATGCEACLYDLYRYEGTDR